MTTTVQATIDRVIRDVQGGDRDEMNLLAANVDTAGTSWSFTYDLNGIQQGSIVCADLETVYVWDTSESSLTATVQRAHEGTTAAAHSAAATVRVNPRFTPKQVFDVVNDQILSLSSEGLFRMLTVDLTTSASVRTYDLTSVATMLGDPWEIRYDNAGSSNEWPVVRNWTVSRNMPTSDFASGLMLRVDEQLPTGRTMRVRYKAPFTAVTAVGDTLETTAGIPATAVDIVMLGAQATLVGSKEPKRAQTEASSDSRRATEVSAGSAIRSATYLHQLRNSRLVREVARLEQEYGPRRRR